ncbi:MAG: NUDIX hydrolase [Thermoflexibacteraceae bacterium]
MNYKTILALLDAHTAVDSQEEFYRQQTHEFIKTNPQNFLQDNPKAHLTASAWIVNPAKTHALLIFHRKLNKWLQVGGHVESTDENLQSAALREAQEETHLKDLRLVSSTMFDIDIHLIPARHDTPAHYHHDFRFLLEAEQSVISVIPAEVLDLQWFPIKELTQTYLARMVQKTLHNAV